MVTVSEQEELRLGVVDCLRLIGEHPTTAQGLTGRTSVELAYEAGDESADLGEQSGMKAEGGSQDLGHGEGEHAVRLVLGH